MTPEQELQAMWPKAQASAWPFPTYQPKEGQEAKQEAKPEVKSIPVITGNIGLTDDVPETHTLDSAVLTGLNGTSAVDITGTTNAYTFGPDWKNVTVSTTIGASNLTTGAVDATVMVLDERAKNYGKFMDMAAITQKLKEILHTAPSWKAMQADQQESLEMIVHKIARILNGRPDYADSWVDIAGYARLVGDRLEKGIVR